MTEPSRPGQDEAGARIDSQAIFVGSSFVKCLSSRDGTSPPAYSFPNRFLNGAPPEWLNEFWSLETVPSFETTHASMQDLHLALGRVPTSYVSVSVYRNLEKSTTTHLAWLTWLIACQAVNTHGIHGVAEYSLWGTNHPDVDACAELIRGAANVAVLACALNPSFHARPELVFEFVVSFLEDLAKPLLATGSLFELRVTNNNAELRSTMAVESAHRFVQLQCHDSPASTPQSPPLPLLSPRPPYVPTANPHRTGWVILSVLVFAAIIAGMIARTRSSNPQAESVRTSPSTTVQIPTSVELSIAQVAAPVPPLTSVAPATTVSDVQRTDVALYVAQSLATAFATADWATARTVSPQNPVWTDDKYALGFEGLQASYLSVAGSRLSRNTVDLWLTEVASELRAGRKRTAIYCVHWMYAEDSRTIQGIAGKTVRTVNGFQDASITTPADADACKQFDGP